MLCPHMISYMPVSLYYVVIYNIYMQCVGITIYGTVKQATL